MKNLQNRPEKKKMIWDLKKKDPILPCILLPIFTHLLHKFTHPFLTHQEIFLCTQCTPSKIQDQHYFWSFVEKVNATIGILSDLYLLYVSDATSQCVWANACYSRDWMTVWYSGTCNKTTWSPVLYTCFM